MTAELATALATTPKMSTHLVVSEITMRPYKADNFRAVFADLRRAAGIADVQFMDLRRTAVVRLAEAGCTVPESRRSPGIPLRRRRRSWRSICRATRPWPGTPSRSWKPTAHGRLEVQTVKLETESEEWCPGADLNHRHADFQSAALPTELPGHRRCAAIAAPPAAVQPAGRVHYGLTVPSVTKRAVPVSIARSSRSMNCLRPNPAGIGSRNSTRIRPGCLMNSRRAPEDAGVQGDRHHRQAKRAVECRHARLVVGRVARGTPGALGKDQHPQAFGDRPLAARDQGPDRRVPRRDRS